MFLILAAQTVLGQVNSVEIRKSSTRGAVVDVRVDATLDAVASAFARHLGNRIDYLANERVEVRYARTGVVPAAALREIVTKSGYELRPTAAGFEIRDPDEPVVNLDVHDADVREILGAMKKQCEVTNLIVDRNVAGKGTFLLRDVPCGSGFRTVFTSLGLAWEWQPNSVLIVGVRK